MASVPEVNGTSGGNPSRTVCAPPDTSSTPGQKQLRADAIRALRNYRTADDALGLLPLLERLQQMCRQNLEVATKPAGRVGPSAATADLVPLSTVVRDHVVRVYQALGSNKTRAARVLEIDIKTLYNKLKRYGVQ